MDERILGWLRDPDEGKRAAAMDHLSRRKSAGSLQLLLQAVHREEDPWLFVFSLECLLGRRALTKETLDSIYQRLNDSGRRLCFWLFIRAHNLSVTPELILQGLADQQWFVALSSALGADAVTAQVLSTIEEGIRHHQWKCLELSTLPIQGYSMVTDRHEALALFEEVRSGKGIV